VGATLPAGLSSKEQPLSLNSRFWRESPGPRALPENVNPFNAKNGRLTKFSKHKALYIFYNKLSTAKKITKKYK
jgi:hypothetical protein